MKRLRHALIFLSLAALPFGCGDDDGNNNTGDGGGDAQTDAATDSAPEQVWDGGGGCMNRGQCLGVVTNSLPTDMIMDCFEVCQDDYECVAFSYNYGTGECQNYETCEEVN